MLSSLALFHIVRRLMRGYSWFAFTAAAIYLVYVPYESSHSTYWLAPYSGVLFLCMVAAVVIVEMMYAEKSPFLLPIGLLAGYAAIRGYEGIAPIVFALPVLILLLKWPINRRGLVISGVWFAVLGIAALQFLVPYIRQDEAAWYQLRRQEPTVNPVEFAENTLRFNTDLFPTPDMLADTHYEFVAPALLTLLIYAGVAYLLLRVAPDEAQLPTPVQLMWLFAWSVAFITIAGLGFIYANLLDRPRSQFYAEPARAVMIISLFTLLAWGAHRVLQLRPRTVLAGLLAVLFVSAMQWHFGFNADWNSPDDAIIPLNERNDFFRQAMALMPDVEDDTLILLEDCQTFDEVPLSTYISARDAYAVRYLYGAAWGRGIEMGFIDNVFFGVTGSDYDPQMILGTVGLRHYDYSQMLVLACDGDDLVVLERFPQGIAPENADTSSYNPYSRIRQDFIPSGAARMLSY
jgi:hypothetical protein